MQENRPKTYSNILDFAINNSDIFYTEIFNLAIDDRIKLMEDNMAWIEKIYFPKAFESGLTTLATGLIDGLMAVYEPDSSSDTTSSS